MVRSSGTFAMTGTCRFPRSPGHQLRKKGWSTLSLTAYYLTCSCRSGDLERSTYWTWSHYSSNSSCAIQHWFVAFMRVSADGCSLRWVSFQQLSIKFSRLPCQLSIPPFLMSNGNHMTYYPSKASLGLWIRSRPGVVYISTWISSGPSDMVILFEKQRVHVQKRMG